MTRSRARRSTQGKIPRVLSSKNNSLVVVVKSYSNALLNNATHIYAGNKQALHPANGVVSSTPVSQLWSDNILGPNLTLAAGLFTKGTIRKVKTIITFRNQEGFPVICKIGYLNSNSYTNFTNNSQIQDTYLLCDKKIIVNQNGIDGYVKTVILTWDVPALEGNFDSSSYRQNTNYFITYASGSSAGYGWYVQINDEHLTSNLVNGVSINCEQHFVIDAIQSNKMLLV